MLLLLVVLVLLLLCSSAFLLLFSLFSEFNENLYSPYCRQIIWKLELFLLILCLLHIFCTHLATKHVSSTTCRLGFFRMNYCR